MTIPPTPPRPVTYMLRTVSADMTAYGGFKYPVSGYYEVPDWNPEPVCGGGSHGLLMGAGSAGYLASDADAKWMVVEVYADEVVDIENKVKVPRTTENGVVFCGDRSDLLARGADPAVCVYSTLTGGDRSTLTGGDGSTLICRWWDGQADRYRTAMAECADDGLKVGVAYRVADGKFVEVSA
jgi:uncharacterized protein YodC (DUF2158 family)